VPPRTPITRSTPSGPSRPSGPHPVTDGDPGPLRSLTLFAGLPGAEIEELAARCAVSTAHPGQVVQAQGVPVRMWHVITAGHAVVQRDGTPIGLLGRGDSWSEHSILNGLRSAIAVVALSPLTLLTLSERDFFEIPEHHPVLAGRLVARAAFSADRLALPLFDALLQAADTECNRGRRDGQYD
jgi:CRP-like cAMP-binding protein